MIKEKPKILIEELRDENLFEGFLETLSNLSLVGIDTNDKTYVKKIFDNIQNSGNIRIFVARNQRCIMGSITAIIEQKFIHNGGKVCHIEDVVTRKGFEKLGIGTMLVKKAIDLAVQEQCYKIILNCSEYNRRFYERFGFYKHDLGMRYDVKK